MENPEQVLEKREKKITDWFKNKYNLAFFSLIVFTVLLRLYYFFMTQNQPIWWDEGDYLDLARRWAFGQYYWVDPARQVLFSFITSLFFRISDSEFLPRLFITILSIASVIAVYYLGKEMYDKKVGLIAGLFMSVFYMNMFFTFRLINDIPSLTFFTFSAHFFYKYFKTNSKKMLYLASVMIGIGALFKLTTASILFVVLIYLLVTEKLKFLKKKEIWIAALIFIVILAPYVIWGYSEYHTFVILRAEQSITMTSVAPLYVIWPGVMMNYIKMLPSYLFIGFSQTSPLYGYLSLILIFGLIIAYLFKLVIGFDILLKNTSENEKTLELRRDFYLILLLLVHFVLVSYLITHNEDRYILNSFPALFIIFGVFIMKAYGYFEKHKMKVLGILIVIGLILFFVVTQLKLSNSTIVSKLDSYSQVRDAGIWFKENSEPSDVMASISIAQVEYYSGRQVISFPETKEEFESKTIPEKHPRYYMLSGFEPGPEWSRTYPQEKNLTVKEVFFIDAAKTQPIVVIYELPKDINPSKSTNIKTSGIINETGLNKTN